MFLISNSPYLLQNTCAWVKVQVHFFYFQYKTFCILYKVCASIFLSTGSPYSFLLWALQKSALCSNGDHVLTSSFLNNHSSSGHLSLKHTPDFPIPASWPWLYWLYLLQQTGTITGLPRQWMKQVSPDMPAVYLGWF